MMPLESHPGVPLIEHLQKVANNCQAVARTNTTDFGLSQSTKETIAYVCGAFHDLGKATTYFQNYLTTKSDSSGLKNHALPSAAFVFYAIKKFSRSLSEEEKDQTVFLASLCFTVVRKHHGHLNNLNQEMALRSKREELQKQYAAIDPESAQALIDTLLENRELDIRWNDFLEWFDGDELLEEVEYEFLDFYQDEYHEDWPNQQKAAAYYLFLWLFGTLLYSDKSDVILSGALPSIPDPTLTYLTKYREVKNYHNPSGEINRLKNEAFFSVLDSIDNRFDPTQRFYSITLPTGLGKTFTSLGAALSIKARARLTDGKIIIAIPFTSIIDQNFGVYDDVFEHPDSAFLLKHHHLASPLYKEKDDDVRDNDQSQHLIETWQSAVVVTTFVQLIECLITNNKSKLLKFPSLSNSVILLDEVQQIPYQYWTLIRQALFTVAEHLNCYFVLMSATQPLIFHPHKEINELVADHETYFSYFNRTQIINKIDHTITLDEFINDVAGYAEANPTKHVLIILNTKKVTLSCFERLKECIDENTEIRYLTTLITPYERKAIINEIKNPKPDRRYIIVSTQLVEAGVDISVDTVFRALAPLDSIIQAAGRANRYNEKSSVSDVFLYNIEELQKVSNRLYGAELMQKTRNVIDGKKTIPESDYLALIKEYFNQVKDLSDFGDHSIRDALLALRFQDAGEFKLIDEIASESLFVALNNQATEVWNRYVAIQGNSHLSPLDRRKAFSKIKSAFYEYVVNVPIPYGKQSIDLPYEPHYGFYLWEQAEPKSFYRYDASRPAENTGYSELSNLSF